MFNSVSRLITCSPPSWFRLRSAASSSASSSASKKLSKKSSSSAATISTSENQQGVKNVWEGIGTEAAANAIENSKNIVFVLGAGISSPLLPDFRTKDIGLYDQIRKSGKFNHLEGSELLAECPEEIFTPEFIQRYPKLFFHVVEEMKLWPASRDQNVPATKFHQFMASLAAEKTYLVNGEQKSIITSIITQNVDGLERRAGINPNLIVEAHGTFAEAKCMNPKGKGHEHSANPDHIRNVALTGEVPTCDVCGSILRPGVVLFGDPLPERFFTESERAVKEADLMIIAGTSLNVFPVAALPDQVGSDVPRILINREISDHVKNKFDFMNGENHREGRDLFLQGDCQEIAEDLVKKLKLRNVKY